MTKEEIKKRMSLLAKETKCQECDNKPDWVYDCKDWSGPIIICNKCKEVFESIIKAAVSPTRH